MLFEPTLYCSLSQVTRVTDRAVCLHQGASTPPHSSLLTSTAFYSSICERIDVILFGSEQPSNQREHHSGTALAPPPRQQSPQSGTAGRELSLQGQVTRLPPQEHLHKLLHAKTNGCRTPSPGLSRCTARLLGGGAIPGRRVSRAPRRSPLQAQPSAGPTWRDADFPLRQTQATTLSPFLEMAEG